MNKRILFPQNRHIGSLWYILCGLVLIMTFRLFMCEVYMVDSPSMIPSILPTEIYCVDKLSGGAIMPRRFAEIPIINVFTWIRPLREMDERNDWGAHRFPKFREFKKGDVILFYALDGSKNVIVKRIETVYKENGQTSYFVLGDNRDNSTDSRSFGPVPDNMVIGRAKHVLFSWDNEAKGLQKVRWDRIGFDISKSKAGE